MKKIVTIFVGLMAVYCANAADTNQICQRNGTALIVIQRDVNGTVSETDGMSWAVSFNYDLFADSRGGGANTVNGASTCNDINTKSNAAGTSGTESGLVPGDANTFLRAADDDTGTNCWCRMVSTISSWWVFAKAFSSADDCASSCNAFCANGMANNTEIGSDGRKLRYAMFDAMW